VNPLASRMLDSSLDNVGTYGVRFNVDLNLQGDGPYELVLSHPSAVGGKPFTAFRGSIQVRTDAGSRDYHVVLRSGQSLGVTTLNLRPGIDNPVRVSLVYPADATPGHLLSVVPSVQLSRLQEQERELELARQASERAARAASARMRSKGKPPAPAQPAPPPPVEAQLPDELADMQQQTPVTPMPPPIEAPIAMPPDSFPQSVAPAVMPPPRVNQTLIDRYQQALEAQQSIMRGLMTR